MNCTQFRRCTDAIADGEVDPSLEQEAANHSDHCPDCARSVERIQGLKAALNRSWEDGQASQQLRDRVRVSLQTEPVTLSGKAEVPPAVSASRQLRPYLVPAALAAVLALAVAISFLATRGGGRKHRLAAGDVRVVQDIRAQHRACVARRSRGHHDPSLSRDLATIAKRLSERLNLSVFAPDLSMNGFELVGADRCGIPGYDGAHVLYESRSAGTALSVYTVERVAAMRPNSAGPAGKRDCFIATDTPETVLAWHDAGQTYISCGRVDESLMMELMGHTRVASTPFYPPFFVGMLSPSPN